MLLFIIFPESDQFDKADPTGYRYAIVYIFGNGNFFVEPILHGNKGVFFCFSPGKKPRSNHRKQQESADLAAGEGWRACHG